MTVLVVGWTWPAAKYLPSCLLTPPLPQQGGGKNWKSRSWKHMGRDEDSWISEAKQHTQAKQIKEFIYCFPQAGRCSSQFLGRRASAHITISWEDRCNKHKYPPSFSFPQAFDAEHDIIWFGISLWTVWASHPGFFPSHILACSQSTRCRGRGGKSSYPKNSTTTIVYSFLKVFFVVWPFSLITMGKQCVTPWMSPQVEDVHCHIYKWKSIRKNTREGAN